MELVPVPVSVLPSGILVNVQIPEEGKPFRTTLPVAKVQVVWVTVPTIGAAGVTGWALTTTLADEDDIQPDALVTLNV